MTSRSTDPFPMSAAAVKRNLEVRDGCADVGGSADVGKEDEDDDDEDGRGRISLAYLTRKTREVASIGSDSSSGGSILTRRRSIPDYGDDDDDNENNNDIAHSYARASRPPPSAPASTPHSSPKHSIFRKLGSNNKHPDPTFDNFMAKAAKLDNMMLDFR
eukprot:TRINITY_DN5440_c0_g1_i1.p1 TRINITY_DN5440_c0_g1~~TRINITY_DN5440_c0_g1_i1.p1  ORF type:complete len:160 (+),score=42.43 TRINITY_DN5440_c0_g1_i1:158-637(+)